MGAETYHMMEKRTAQAAKMVVEHFIVGGDEGVERETARDSKAVPW